MISNMEKTEAIVCMCGLYLQGFNQLVWFVFFYYYYYLFFIV